MGPGDSDGGVFFQRYNVAGSPIGPETRVNAVSSGLQNVPSVAMAPDGRFAVVWQSPNGDDAALKSEIYLRLFDATGTPVAGFETKDVVVNQDSLNGDSVSPAVAMDSLGRFVVVWTFNNTAMVPTSPLEVRLKAFQASGLPAAAPEQTVAAPVAGALYPDVAMRADGRCGRPARPPRGEARGRRSAGAAFRGRGSRTRAVGRALHGRRFPRQLVGPLAGWLLAAVGWGQVGETLVGCTDPAAGKFPPGKRLPSCAGASWLIPLLL